MTDPFVTESQVLDLVGRFSDDLDDRMAEAVAHALRLYSPRRELPQGSLSAAFGTVSAVYGTYCDVMFDTDTKVSAVPTLGTPVVGQRVLVLNIPPASALVIASGGGGTPSTGSSGAPVALWELPGPVIPVAAADAPNVPIVTDGELTGVTLSLDEAPATGLALVVDVFLNGVSIFATKPTLAAGETLGHFALPAPVAVAANVDVVTAAVLTPAGRTLVIALA
jgi:hypothetical protein